MDKILLLFNRALDVLYKILTWICFVSLVLICSMVVLQVILRYVFHAPLFGIEELEIFPIMWIYIFGAGMASYEKKHISCGVAGVLVKNKKAVKIIDTIMISVSLIIATYICIKMYPHFAYILRIWKRTSTLNVPVFFCDGAIFIGVVIMILFTVRDFLTEISKYFKKC